jgi:aminoglycoside phosphotransferase (APT) family kinase protein
VIDWGDIHIGDRAVDLAIAFSFVPPRARKAFGEAYGAIDDATWRLARFRAVVHAAAVARYAHGVGNEELLRDSLRSLGCALEGEPEDAR